MCNLTNLTLQTTGENLGSKEILFSDLAVGFPPEMFYVNKQCRHTRNSSIKLRKGTLEAHLARYDATNKQDHNSSHLVIRDFIISISS